MVSWHSLTKHEHDVRFHRELELTASMNKALEIEHCHPLKPAAMESVPYAPESRATMEAKSCMASYSKFFYANRKPQKNT